MNFVVLTRNIGAFVDDYQGKHILTELLLNEELFLG